MKSVLYITGTRAEYELMRATLNEIRREPQLELRIAATGQHLMPAHGRTLERIKADGHSPVVLDADFSRGTGAFLKNFSAALTEDFTKERPDVLLVVGDRPEALLSAVIATYHDVPIVHVHGGEVSGTKDETARHAITKLAHVHLAATARSAERIKRLGEESWRIHVVGAPGVHAAVHATPAGAEEFSAFFGELEAPIVVLYHPARAEGEGAHMRALLDAALDTGHELVVFQPNSDPGNEEIRAVIAAYKEHHGIKVFAHAPQPLFHTLLRRAAVLVGNSSAGIIEAASFRLPVVNVGDRETGRERGANVIDCAPTRQAITHALAKALAMKKQEWQNPYYRPDTPTRITRVLTTLRLDERTRNKKLEWE